MKRSTPSILICSGLAMPALATDTSWVGVSGAPWSAPASWSAGVPGTQDRAVFASVGPQRTVALDSTGDTILVDRLRFDKGLWRFTGSTVLHAQAANAFSASIVAGALANTSCFIDWSSTAELRATRLELATSGQAYSELRINNGGITVAEDARIGLVGDGALLLKAPSSFGTLELGTTATGFGLIASDVESTGASGGVDGLTVRNQCTVGKFGEGELLTGASARFGALMLGQNAGSSGTMSAVEARIDGALTVGHAGSGSLTVTGAASVAGQVVLAALEGGYVPPFPQTPRVRSSSTAVLCAVAASSRRDSGLQTSRSVMVVPCHRRGALRCQARPVTACRSASPRRQHATGAQCAVDLDCCTMVRDHRGHAGPHRCLAAHAAVADHPDPIDSWRSRTREDVAAGFLWRGSVPGFCADR